MIFLNEVLIVFYSRLQATVALSTFEAEYTALVECVREVLTVRNFLGDLDIDITPAAIYCDQEKVVSSCYSGQILTSRQVRHIMIRFQHVVDHLSKGTIALQWISTVDNLADPLTKPMDGEDIDSFTKKANLKRMG